MNQSSRIALLIPCYNEEATIASVIADFAAVLPEAIIFVCDNNSTDRTAAAAAAAGAIVRTETMQGKGHVVRRMFSDIEADIYILVDGDGTYDAASAHEMLRLFLDRQVDMVVGVRVPQEKSAYRPGHRTGNVLLTSVITYVFGDRVTDMLSGYRILSRRFVKSFPALAGGFETETELTVHALTLNMPILEVATPYRDRPSGSTSKLRTYRDGMVIFRSIIMLIKEERPLQFFATIGFILLALGVLIALPLVSHYLQTGLVPRLPTAVLATALVLLAFLSQVCGLILDSVARGRKEIKHLAYLSHPARFYETR